MTTANAEPSGLTRRQTLFWLDEQLYPGAAYHHHALTIRLSGTLDRERLLTAFVETQRAIDQFRIVIEVVEGEPVQRVRDDLVIDVEEVDLSRDPGRFPPLLAERTARPFVWSESLHRAMLVQLAPTTHVFCVLLHHIVSDGASVALIVKELEARYTGAPTTYHPPFLQYVASERAYVGSKKAERDAAYWKSKLDGGIPELRFYGETRTDRSVDAIRVWLDGGHARSEALHRRATEEPIHLLNESVSRLVALATILFAFMHRVTGNRKLAIGTPIPNRSAQFVETCGLLMEQLFVCVEVDETETFASLASKVRSDLFQSLRHGQATVSDRGVDYVTLNLLPHRFGAFGDLEARVELQSVCTMADSSFPLVEGDRRDTFGVQIHDFRGSDAFLVGFDFHRATFDAELRENAPAHFWRIVDAFLEDLERPIGSVALVDGDERARLLALGRGRWDDRESAPPDLLVSIRAAIAARGEAPAIEAAGEVIRYAELGARIDALAGELRALGVGPGTRVALYLERGADEVLTMLATLVAGGAYVPLDPSHPLERVGLVLEDASPSVLVTHGSRVGALALSESVRVLALDREWPRILDAVAERREGETFVHAPRADEPAYVLFTSGSTGRPKGVEISRGAFSNFLRSMAHTPGMGPEDRLLAVTTITFDIAGLELLLPLTVGASVRIADRDTALDPVLLRRVLESEPITTIQATPATFRLLVEAGWEGSATLRVLVGGEALSPELAAALLVRTGELWNMYGPTETTVWSTIDRVRDASHITIGRPIDRTQVEVLDAARNLVPRGVVGELAIGGEGVANGYVGRPELTAERFVPDPSDPRGGRLYLTGDLARFLPDGRLECLGRIDHQVKIRGFRIELGEIESALRAVDGVLDVVVVARRDGGPDPRLVAYFVTSGSVTHASLREAARARLPAYMHPAAYVGLDAFPLNTNGKIDRNALPAPTDAGNGNGGTGPRRRATSDLEARMVALVRDVLGIDDVGVDEDFFALGGNSPLALELRRRITATYGIELPLRAFFDAPSASGLADRLTRSGSDLRGQLRDQTDDAIVVALRRGPDTVPPLFCLVGIQLYEELARALPTRRTVYGVHVPVRFSPARDAPPSVSAIATRYVTEIRAIQPHGPYHVLGLCFGGLVACEVAARLEAAGERVAIVTVVDAVLPGAVRVDPLRRLRHLARLAVTDSHRIPRFVRREAERLASRLPPSRARALAFRVFGFDSVLAVHDEDEVVELPLLGPLVQEQFAAFEQDVHRLEARLLVVRASQVDLAPGQRIEAHAGFLGRGSEVIVETLPGDHLGLLRAPYVDALAQVLERHTTPT